MACLPPRLIAPPDGKPVTRDEAKAHLRVDDDSTDALIDLLIAAAAEQLDGPGGLLGRCLMTQTWAQDYGFWPASRCLALPLAPVASIVSIIARAPDGVLTTLDPASYRLLGASLEPFAMLSLDAALPSLACEPDALTVTFTAGYGAAAVVPARLRQAMLLMIGDGFRFTESAGAGTAGAIPMSVTVDRLIAPFRRVLVS